MATQVIKTSQPPHPLVWGAGIAVILFCAAGFAAIMGWIPTSIGSTTDIEKSKAANKTMQSGTVKPKTHVTSSAPVTKCSACGAIESVLEISEKGEGSGLGAAGGAVVGGAARPPGRRRHRQTDCDRGRCSRRCGCRQRSREKGENH